MPDAQIFFFALIQYHPFLFIQMLGLLYSLVYALFLRSVLSLYTVCMIIK